MSDKKRRSMVRRNAKRARRTALERSDRRTKRQKFSNPEHEEFAAYYAGKAIALIGAIRKYGLKPGLTKAAHIRKHLRRSVG